MTFEGFVPPTKNYFPVPNNWIDICATIRDISELKVIQYVIRHTWGFHEFGICKTISVDEFMHGRRRQDQTRMDCGTGLSEQSVRNGLNKAIKDGYLICEVDPSDAGRIKKSYALRMQANTGQVQTLDPPQTLDPSTGTNFRPQGTNSYTSDSQSLDLRVPNFIPRTEKDTIERHLDKDTLERIGDIVVSAITENDAPANVYHFEAEKKRITNGRIPAVTKGQDERYDTANDTTTSSNILHSGRNSPSVDRNRLPVHDGINNDFGDTEAQRHVGASHSQVDIGNFEGKDEDDFEGETVPRIEAMPKQPTLGAGSPPAATPPSGSTAASVQASRPSSRVDAAQRTASSPGTPSGAVQASSRDEKPPMALTAKQIEKQLAQRQDEILALYASKIGRKPSRSKANLDGALKLAQDDATDEDISTTIDAILADSFLAKNLSLTFVHSKLDALARKPIPIENKQKAPARDQNIGVSGLPRLQVRKMNYGA